MSYKALYRTYRPSNFDEIAGQQHIVKTLKNAVEKNKIAHAYLFCGPRGTGKTSIAKIFAKAVNCTGYGIKPCGNCPNCVGIGEGTHPDVVEIDAASNNGVEEVRNLIEKVKYAPIEAKYKVYIIDEVHMMSAGAFNALLKTIEEPPAHVIFILATTEPQKVLPTIISRCQRFDFHRVATEDMIPYLKLVLEKEHIKCEDEVIRIIAQLADGGMRDSLSILDQCIAYAQNDIQVKHINDIYGITTIQDKLNLFEWIKTRNVGKLVAKLTELNEKGIDLKRLTIDLIDILKESLIFEYTKDNSLLKQMHAEEAYLLIELFSSEQRLQLIDILLETYDKYRTAANVASYFEVAMLKGMHLEQEKEICSESQENVSRETFKQEKESLMTVTQYQKEENPVHEEELKIVKTEPQADELLMAEQSESTIKPLKDDFVVRLLVGANKPEKQKDLEAMRKLPDYLFDMEWAKYANLLDGCSIVASSSQYLVLCADNQPSANEINELDSNNQFGKFTFRLFDRNKKVFAITAEQSARVIAQFKQAMATNTLPAPVTFNDLKLENIETKEKSEKELVEELFGKENIIVMEE